MYLKDFLDAIKKENIQKTRSRYDFLIGILTAGGCPDDRVYKITRANSDKWMNVPKPGSNCGYTELFSGVKFDDDGFIKFITARIDGLHPKVQKHFRPINDDSIVDCETPEIEIFVKSLLRQFKIILSIPRDTETRKDSLSPTEKNTQTIKKLLRIQSSRRSRAKKDNHGKNTAQRHAQVPLASSEIKIKQTGKLITGIRVIEGVKKVSTSAIDCRNDSMIDISEGVEVIEAFAFKNCQNITEIRLTDSIKYIGPNAFGEIDLEKVIFKINRSNDSLAELYARYQGVRFEFLNAHPSSAENEKVYTAEEAKKHFAGQHYAVVPPGVTSVGRKAFAKNKDIRHVVISEGVKYIEEEAFLECTNLKSISLPSSLLLIGYCAFDESGIANVHLPQGLRFIGNFAFSSCENLRTLRLPPAIQFIGSGAFFDCTELTEVTSDNSSFTIVDGVLFDSNNCLTWANAHSEKVDVSMATAINKGALDNSSCTELRFTDNLKVISDYAFYNSQIRSIWLPDTTINIMDNAFEGCSEDLVIHYRAKDFDVAKFTADYHSTLERSDEAIELTTGEGANDVFEVVCDMTSDYNVISDSALRANERVNRVRTAQGLLAIGESSFERCERLREINIPDAVSLIGNWAFAHCGQLKHIALPTDISYIGDGVFSGTRIMEISLGGEKYICDNGLLYGKHDGRLIWCSPKKEGQVKIPQEVHQICCGAFYNCTLLKSIVIHNTVCEIGDWAFLGCISLEEILVPDSIQSIGFDAFVGTSSKLIIKCKKGTYMDEYAGNHLLAACHIPETMEVISV